MKKLEAIVKNISGLSLIEVLLSMIIIVVSAIAVLSWQNSSWAQTKTTNRLMVAGHIVDKQVENQRMIIARDPPDSFPVFKTRFDNNDVTIIDSSVSPFVSVKWHGYDTLHDPHGHLITDVLQIKLTAWWAGCKVSDSLKLETRISQNF
jgi:Tfp pilus assembly protein PilV